MENNIITKHLNQNKMKGYLHKTEKGWIVGYDKDDGIDSFLLLHPHNVATSSFSFYNGKEVDFEMAEEYLDGNNIFTYAKLIHQENAKPNVEKLAEEVYGKGVNYDYEEGYVDGYNKAEETLYTEEQVVQSMLEISEYIIDALERRYLIDTNEKAKDIIKSLKP